MDNDSGRNILMSKRVKEDTQKYQIPFGKPFISGQELSYIHQAVKSMHLSGDGPYTLKCHQWLTDKLGCQAALLTHSCTAALEMAAILCDLKEGDEVILPSYTFVSTANAFVLRGAVPVFVDIKKSTLNIDEDLIEPAITDRTKAIVAVHYAGTACHMDKIMEISRKHDLLVIEDAAQALLSTYKGKPLGTIGQIGCFSFHETKNIMSGEGGALVINDKRFIERAEIIRDKGTNRKQFFRGDVQKYSWTDIGSSYAPSELIGAFLYAQLENAHTINAARRNACEKYFEMLKPLEESGILRLPHKPDNCENSGHIFYIITKSYTERNQLIDFLASQLIKAVFHYVPLHSSPAGMRYARTSGDMDNTDMISNTLVRLPLFYEITDQEIKRVVEAIREFYSS